MKDRIQKYMDKKNINAGELATMLEVQRSNISHVLNGRNKPSATFIEKMLVVFPDLNARWLLTGQGSMLDIETSQENNGADTSAVSSLFEPNKKETVRHAEPVKSKVNESGLPDLTDDDIDKIIVLYRGGTFSSFKRR